MKIYVFLAALVLGLFIVPAFGEIMVGDNVTFLAFGEESGSGLETGTVLNISEDGDWLLVYSPPDYLTFISKWFIYSDDTLANQVVSNLLASNETIEASESVEPSEFVEITESAESTTPNVSGEPPEPPEPESLPGLPESSGTS